MKFQPQAHIQLSMLGNFYFKQQIRSFTMLLK